MMSMAMINMDMIKMDIVNMDIIETAMTEKDIILFLTVEKNKKPTTY